jgi:hypothetical protein
MKHVTDTSRRGTRLFREAEQWISQDDPTWLYSFLSICCVLGLEPDYVRGGLARWRDLRPDPVLKQAA